MFPLRQRLNDRLARTTRGRIPQRTGERRNAYISTNGRTALHGFDQWIEFAVLKEPMIGIGVQMTNEFVQIRTDSTVLPLEAKSTCFLSHSEGLSKETVAVAFTWTRINAEISSVNGMVKSVNGAMTLFGVLRNTTSLRWVLARLALAFSISSGESVGHELVYRQRSRGSLTVEKRTDHLLVVQVDNESFPHWFVLNVVTCNRDTLFWFRTDGP